MSAEAHGTAGATSAPAEPARRTGATTRVLLLAALPAVVIGILLRYWVGHTWLLSLNSDEALVGLQAREVLDGTFRLIVAGNDYGSTTESYLLAPLMPFGSSAWPLRMLAGAAVRARRLRAVPAGPAVPRARPRPSAIALGLLDRVRRDGDPVVPPVHGVPDRDRRADRRRRAGLPRDAHHREARPAPPCWPGLATGFAVWSHPMFGIVALLALIPPTVAAPSAGCGTGGCRWPLGGLIGVSPWIVYILRHGAPAEAQATVAGHLPERLEIFATELLPRAFGLRLPDGPWLAPAPLAQLAAAVLIIGSLAGLVLLVVRKGRRRCRCWWPVCWRSRASRCSRSWPSPPTPGTRCRSCRCC